MKEWTLLAVAEAWLGAARNLHADFYNDEGRVGKLLGTVRVGGETVIATYRDDTGTLVPRFALSGDLKFHNLTHALLLQLRDARLREGNSHGTINREMSLLQSFVGFAAAHGVRTPAPPINFARRHNKVSALKLQEPPGKLRFLSLAEEARLLAALAERICKNAARGGRQPAQDQCDLCVFLLDSGARYSEVATMTWDVVDLDIGEYDLQRSKGGSSGRFHMTRRLWEVLRRRRIETMGRRYIFPAGCGQGWCYEDRPRGHATHGIQKTIDSLGFNDAVTVAAQGRVTPHTFRDTFASRLVQAGLTLYDVQHLLGHQSPQMTQKYAKLVIAKVSAKAVSILDASQAPGND